MDTHLLRLVLDLYMASDPTPLTSEEDTEMARLLDEESRRHGFEGWVEAYHRVPPLALLDERPDKEST